MTAPLPADRHHVRVTLNRDSFPATFGERYLIGRLFLVQNGLALPFVRPPIRDPFLLDVELIHPFVERAQVTEKLRGTGFRARSRILRGRSGSRRGLLVRLLLIIFRREAGPDGRPGAVRPLIARDRCVFGTQFNFPSCLKATIWRA